jgi:hypothetical protein
MVLAFSTPNNIEVLVRINRILYLDEISLRILVLSFALVIEFIILILASQGEAARQNIMHGVASSFIPLITIDGKNFLSSKPGKILL